MVCSLSGKTHFQGRKPGNKKTTHSVAYYLYLSGPGAPGNASKVEKLSSRFRPCPKVFFTYLKAPAKEILASPELI
jgi:hypothetical protein